MAGPILVAVAGSEPETFWDRLRELLPASAELELLHVIDDEARFEMRVRAAQRPDHVHPHDIEARELEAEKRGAEAILAHALGRIGRQARTVARTGRPEREIVARAREIDASLVVVDARAHSRSAAVGPASVGHVARFVLDHAPCPVLLVRG